MAWITIDSKILAYFLYIFVNFLQNSITYSFLYTILIAFNLASQIIKISLLLLLKTWWQGWKLLYSTSKVWKLLFSLLRLFKNFLSILIKFFRYVLEKALTKLNKLLLQYISMSLLEVISHLRYSCLQYYDRLTKTANINTVFLHLFFKYWNPIINDAFNCLLNYLSNYSFI